ncbi:beta family protein [Hyphococcus sp.]|uniref:beta family protein n=1 Tax=Hyphococcus sp. TaxID=2038636 RepID=UPI0035C6FEA6
MILTNDMYVPGLRWRQGEYQALMRLHADAKLRTVPFITIPDVEFDFEIWAPKKSVQQHVHPFIARYKAKWGKRPGWISVHKNIVEKPMDDGRDILTYVFDGLRAFEANAVPAIPLSAAPGTINSLAQIVKRDTQGAAFVIQLEDLMKPNLAAVIRNLAKAVRAEIDEVDLIVDLGAPNFEPYPTFSGALIASLGKVDSLNSFRNFVVLGTAIPYSFKDVAKGHDAIVRHDWLFYKTFLENLPDAVRRPVFGDYTIVHPDFVPLDMRKIKSAGKVVYTTPDFWWVRKGGAFRDNPEQMHDHCSALVKQDFFCGADYSNGDEYIAQCAKREVGPSNQTRWKDITINHHITRVLDDLSRLGGVA